MICGLSILHMLLFSPGGWRQPGFSGLQDGAAQDEELRRRRFRRPQGVS